MNGLPYRDIWQHLQKHENDNPRYLLAIFALVQRVDQRANKNQSA
jgi:hypothetical protein